MGSPTPNLVAAPYSVPLDPNSLPLVTPHEGLEAPEGAGLEGVGLEGDAGGDDPDQEVVRELHGLGRDLPLQAALADQAVDQDQVEDALFELLDDSQAAVLQLVRAPPGARSGASAKSAAGAR